MTKHDIGRQRAMYFRVQVESKIIYDSIEYVLLDHVKHVELHFGPFHNENYSGQLI